MASEENRLSGAKGLDNAQARSVLVVLGMHRSGTSLAARLTQLFGARLGDRLLPPQPDNPEGFYEDVDVVALNTAILRAAKGADWHSLDWLDEQFVNGSGVPTIDDLGAQVKALTQSRLTELGFWAFKDPRTLRTLRIWLRAFASLGVDVKFLVVFRRPEAVCSSLARRDGMMPEQAALLWLLHYLEPWPVLEPQRLAFVDYDDLLAAPDASMERAGRQLGLKLDDGAHTELEGAVRRDLNHAHAPNGAQWGIHGESLRHLAEQVYDDLRRLQGDPNDAAAMMSLSAGADRLRQSAPILSAMHGMLSSLQARWVLDQDRLYDRLSTALSVAALDSAGLRLENGGLRAEISRLAAQEQFYGRALAELDLTYRNSTSWRLTAPLRTLANWKTRILYSRSEREKPGLAQEAASPDTDINVLREGGRARPAEYARWIECHEPVNATDLSRLRAEAQGMAVQPLISVVMPTYKTPVKWLRLAIESVLQQIYSNWELCIVDDASEDQELVAMLKAYGERDARLKVRFRSTNGHISQASNDALEMATGEIVTFLDHDDEMAPNALFEVAKAFAGNGSLMMAYSDEDMIDTDGVRYHPYFKSDLNRDLLRAQNMVTHLVAYRLDRVRKLRCFRPGFEGAQDYDLVLRYVEGLPDDAICHISKVLYHWRAIEGSTATSGSAKPYAADAGRRAVMEHLQRLGVSGEVVIAPGLPEGSTFQRVIYSAPPEGVEVSIVIPTRDGFDLLLRCLRSIFRSAPSVNYEIIVVDNGTSEIFATGYLNFLRRSKPNVRVLHFDGPFNFSKIINFGVRHARGDIVCLLNNDTEVISPNWLDELAAQTWRPEVGAVGAKLLYTDRTIQHAGVVLGIGGTAGHLFKHFDGADHGPFGLLKLTRNCAAVTGACLAVRKSLFLEVGGFDEESFAVAFNDVDFCLRLAMKGFNNVWTPYAELYHHESASRGYENTPEKKERFEKEARKLKEMWGSALENDRFYNKNLTRDREDGSISLADC